MSIGAPRCGALTGSRHTERLSLIGSKNQLLYALSSSGCWSAARQPSGSWGRSCQCRRRQTAQNRAEQICECLSSHSSSASLTEPTALSHLNVRGGPAAAAVTARLCSIEPPLFADVARGRLEVLHLLLDLSRPLISTVKVSALPTAAYCDGRRHAHLRRAVGQDVRQHAGSGRHCLQRATHLDCQPILKASVPILSGWRARSPPHQQQRGGERCGASLQGLRGLHRARHLCGAAAHARAARRARRRPSRESR